MLLLVGPYPPPVHGASLVARRVHDTLVEAGHEVRVVSTNVPPGRGYHARRILRHLVATGTLLAAARHGRVVLYQTGAGGGALWYQAVLSAVGRIVGVKQVFHHHSYAYLTSRSRAARAVVAVGGPTMRHVVLCDDMGKELARRYGCHEIRVVSNAAMLQPADPRAANQPPEHRKYVGHLSNLSLDKGVGLAMEAVVELRRRGHDVALRLAGPATSPEVECVIRKHLDAHGELDSWAGPLTSSEVREFMAELDCFVFPSSYVNEALPMVVLEALQTSTPVVTTSVGCLGSVLGRTGWIAPGSVTGLADRIEELLADPGATERAGRLFNEIRGRGPKEIESAVFG